MNAMDHVTDFRTMSEEVIRVLAPGGCFVGSFNLNEPPSFSEPQTLTQEIIEENLLRHLNVTFVKTAPMAPGEDRYRWVSGKEKGPALADGEKGFLWVRAEKN